MFGRKTWRVPLKGTARAVKVGTLTRVRGLARARRAIQQGLRMEVPRTTGLVVQKGEFKSIDFGGGGAINTTGAVALLNGVAPGSGIGDRIGRQITMKSIQLKIESYSTAATGVSQIHRFLLVYDKQTNATALTTTDVLTGTTPLSMRELENRKRFIVLMDRCLEISADGNEGDYKHTDFYKKVTLTTTFNSGVAGTVADITTGSLYLVWTGTEAPGATAGTMGFNSRIRYLDN